MGAVLSAGCGANRHELPQVAGQTDPPPLPRQATGPALPTPDPVDQTQSSGNLGPAVRKDLESPQPLPDLIERARHQFSEGKKLFESGALPQARERFDRSLDTLRNSSLEFFDHPELERAYYDLFNKIQTIEIQATMDLDDLQARLSESTPLEKIAEVNLFEIEVDRALEEVVSADLRHTHFDFPVVLNKVVLKFLNYYQGPGRRIMEEGLRRSGKYLDLFRAVFQEVGVPTDLVYMSHIESLFKPTAYSRARARGLWQFVKGTGRRYGLRVNWWLDERSDIEKSTRAAARHLRDLHRRFGDWHLALAAYNVGAGRIARILKRYGRMDYWTMARRRLLPRETIHYVPSILASIIIFRHPQLYGFKVRPQPALAYEAVALNYQVDLGVVAKTIGVSVASIAELNPELRRGVTPFDSTDYRLKVPVGKGEPLLERLAQVPAEKRLRLKHHRVRSGETLSRIARAYGVSMHAIAEVNRIRNIHRLKINQNLIIPLGGWRGGRASAHLGVSPHVVRRGDSLSRIAHLYGISVKDLWRWNNLGPGAIIYPGQRIRVKAPVAGSQRTNAGN
ncbi:MAG: LysM peptidoglycan-binding domain-containing protein [Acidobacteriota bacterium]